MDSPVNKQLNTEEVLEEIRTVIMQREGYVDNIVFAVRPKEVGGNFPYPWHYMKKQRECLCAFIPYNKEVGQDMLFAVNNVELWHIWFIDGQHNYKRIF